MTFFFYGTLCHLPLLGAVIGRQPVTRPARLPGFAAVWAAGEQFPVLAPDPDAVALGVVVDDLTAEEIARLDFYEGGFACFTQEVELLDQAGAAAAPTRAQVFKALPGRWMAGEPWRLADWAAVWGDVVTEAAVDAMALFGRKPSSDVHARWQAMLVRAASRLRARAGGPTTLRHRAGPGDIDTLAWRQPYAAYFAVEETDLRFARFAGGKSAALTRAVFIAGDAAVVLPYDPVRDRVLLIEQFRAAPLARGDGQPWMLEPVAGRIDPGETPEDAARREATEEAGVKLGALIPVISYYPSPGAVSEYLYTFIGLADLPDSAARIGGLETEGEDIRGHLVDVADLMALIASGEVENGPLILAAWWLEAHRDRLRDGVLPGGF